LKKWISKAAEKMTVKNAYEYKGEYDRQGKCLKKEFAIGPIVPFAIITALVWLFGRTPPDNFWQLFKHLL
jgi:hypothetical protein